MRDLVGRTPSSAAGPRPATSGFERKAGRGRPARTGGSAPHLPLHSPRAAALEQRLHFIHRDAVEISGYRVLQAACRYREIESFLMIRERQVAVDQTAGET